MWYALGSALSLQVRPLTPPSNSFLANFPPLPLYHHFSSSEPHYPSFETLPQTSPCLKSGPFPINLLYCQQIYLKPNGMTPWLKTHHLLFSAMGMTLFTTIPYCSLTLTLQPWSAFHQSLKLQNTLYTSLIVLMLFPLPKLFLHPSSMCRSCDHEAGS